LGWAGGSWKRDRDGCREATHLCGPRALWDPRHGLGRRNKAWPSSLWERLGKRSGETCPGLPLHALVQVEIWVVL